MDAVRSYVEVWSEPDSSRREQLLRQCWTEESEIVGPGYSFKGVKAVLDEAARFQRDDPGARAMRTSEVDQHDNWCRFTIAMVNQAGEVVTEGWDIIELNPDGKIARVITFWGKLQPRLPTPEASSGFSELGDA